MCVFILKNILAKKETEITSCNLLITVPMFSTISYCVCLYFEKYFVEEKTEIISCILLIIVPMFSTISYCVCLYFEKYFGQERD